MRNMLKKVGCKAQWSSDPKIIEQATKLIFPGVGSFDLAMKKLLDSGLVPILEKKVLHEKTPLLGVCLGMQLLTQGSEEGEMPGLGWVKAQTKKFRPTDKKLKIPHMGWNEVVPKVKSKLTKNLDQHSRFYFVHSYFVECENPENILFESDYGQRFASGIFSDNIFGVQFHPEKSHRFGMQLMANYLEI
ncbi:MAG: imidazole glycerol phosphate synthase subunit HisH [Bdellovibrionales bacterium]|nr:imidazole glycerol phosphate synthase subunit HisH [Bdellovibrionales bacterium]